MPMRRSINGIGASAVLAYLIVTLGLPLRAQDATEVTEPADPPPATEQPARPPAAERPAGDYQATEQISEDLSVSFPIDI